MTGQWGEVKIAMPNHTMAAERRRTLNGASECHLCSSTEKIKNKHGRQAKKIAALIFYTCSEKPNDSTIKFCISPFGQRKKREKTEEREREEGRKQSTRAVANVYSFP